MSPRLLETAQPSMYERSRVAFESGRVDCAGYLYLPRAESGRMPCVVLCQGFSGTMDWIVPRVAARFAEARLAVLIFDYRHFGESGGEPRQLVSVARQREDIHAAVRFVRTRAEIDPDRVALWGTSLGGGHVIAVAAEDPRIAAVVAQMPGIDMVRRDARATIKVPATTLLRLLSAAVLDAIRGALGLPPYYAKVFGDPGETAVFTDPALRPRFAALEKGSRTWRNLFTPRFYLALPRYRRGMAERITMPLLVCLAERDVYGNPAFPAWFGKQAPRGEVRWYAGGHFDLYHDLFDQVVEDQVVFLIRHLAPF